MRKQLWALMALAVVACGGDSTGPSDSYERIANTWVGEIEGISQGVAMVADFTLTISQSGGSLSGTWALDGAISDGIDAAGIAGSGTLTGSIASGNNPSVNITIRRSVCPNNTMTLSGSLDSANDRITLVGPIDLLYDDCTLFRRFQLTLLLLV